jgi:hypothetical protein
MPARHHERYCATPPKLFTFSLESRSRSVGIGVHVVAETLITIDRNKHRDREEINFADEASSVSPNVVQERPL